MKSYFILCSLLLLTHCSHAQSGAPHKAQAAAGIRSAPASAKVDYPPRIDPFLKIRGADHPGLGAYIVGLGDVNGDGYGDFAVSSTLDTTFIFFGGPNLDDQPDAFVLGGGRGLIAGDINGDGYTDLVTAQLDINYILDPDNRGLVRVYLHNHSSHPYSVEPDLKMIGKNKNSGFALGGSTHLLGGDVNGDGKLDLFIEGYNDKTPNGKGIVYLYLGSAIPDTIPDFQFMDTRGGEPRSNFGEKFCVEDLNNDGYDDLIIQGMGRSYTNEEIHLGNPLAQFGAPYKDLNFQDPFNSGDFPLIFVDIDGNECKEIFPFRQQNDPPFGWGRCGADFPNQTFTPDTLFPNPYPPILGASYGIHSLRRISGTKYQNYVTHWAVPLILDGMSNWIYQSGPGWQMKAVAYYGTQALRDGLSGDVVFPIGDVTGDTIDDFALIAGYPLGVGYPVWLFKGDTQYILTGMQAQSIPSAPAFQLYPNPVTAFDAKQISLRGNLKREGTVILGIFDVLGRERLHIEKTFELTGAFQIPICIEALPSGRYFVSAHIDDQTTVCSLTILSE